MNNIILPTVFGAILLTLSTFYFDFNLLNFLMVLAGPVLFLIFNFPNTKQAFNLLFTADLTSDQQQTTNTIIDMANIARKDGILALEKVKLTDPFFQSMVNYCVDGVDPEFLKSIAKNHMETASNSRKKSLYFLRKSILVAVKWGVVLSLITLNWTFLAYGFIMLLSGSIVIFSLQNKIEAKRLQNKTIVYGIGGIQRGVNPRILLEALNMFDADRVNGITKGEKA